MKPRIPELGVGLVLWPELMPVLSGDDGIVDVVEIEPEFFWFESGERQSPMRIDSAVVEQIAALPVHKLVHGVASPVGGSLPPRPHSLGLMRQVVERLHAPWASEHLSFNAVPAPAGRREAGFLLPPLQSQEGAQQAAANIHAMACHLQMPVAVETNVNYLKPRTGELADGDFIARVVNAADCGIVLDLHNLWVNEQNGRQPVMEVLAAIPLDRVWEIHLAGGTRHRGYWLDSHSGLVHPEVMALAARVVPALPSLGAIIFEMLPAYVDDVGTASVRRQLEQLHALWAKRKSSAQCFASPRTHEPTAACIPMSPLEWELALASAVSGSDEADTVPDDAGILLLRELARDARAGQIASSARLTTRLLLASGGDAMFREVFDPFLQANPPRQFASTEALGFLDHASTCAAHVPHLVAVARFESEVIRSALHKDQRIIRFDGDPLPMLAALAERRAPPAYMSGPATEVLLDSGRIVQLSRHQEATTPS